MFQYPLNLHCSQTIGLYCWIMVRFQYPLNLHCSQTLVVEIMSLYGFNTLWIYTALKLYADTDSIHCGFNTLWIYTALKPCPLAIDVWIVSIPSEFTLLSNLCVLYTCPREFQYPLNLHCSQTRTPVFALISCFNTLWIYTALKQVACKSFFKMVSIPSEFTLLSNSVVVGTCRRYSFNTLWIYTALKLCNLL